jgi:hypothetical protein
MFYIHVRTCSSRFQRTGLMQLHLTGFWLNSLSFVLHSVLVHWTAALCERFSRTHWSWRSYFNESWITVSPLLRHSSTLQPYFAVVLYGQAQSTTLKKQFYCFVLRLIPHPFRHRCNRWSWRSYCIVSWIQPWQLHFAVVLYRHRFNHWPWINNFIAPWITIPLSHASSVTHCPWRCILWSFWKDRCNHWSWKMYRESLSLCPTPRPLALRNLAGNSVWRKCQEEWASTHMEHSEL